MTDDGRISQRGAAVFTGLTRIKVDDVIRIVGLVQSVSGMPLWRSFFTAGFAEIDGLVESITRRRFTTVTAILTKLALKFMDTLL